MTPEELQFQKQLVDAVRLIVKDELDNMNLLKGHLRFGTVVSVLPSAQLSVYIDGSTVSQTIDCNPDITFQVGDFVWVTLVNGDSKNKFIFSRRK